jgi:prepilin signal peptidase PulO-like enzyme (type II secretory pathway)
VFGLTQFVKELLGWSGQKVTVLAALMGALVMVSFQLIGIVPDPYGQVVEIFYASVAFGLSASGYYKFIAERLPKKESEGAG